MVVLTDLTGLCVFLGAKDFSPDLSASQKEFALLRVAWGV